LNGRTSAGVESLDVVEALLGQPGSRISYFDCWAGIKEFMELGRILQDSA
jgi:hypothetical protein